MLKKEQLVNLIAGFDKSRKSYDIEIQEKSKNFSIPLCFITFFP